jgi:hypothetical protein
MAIQSPRRSRRTLSRRLRGWLLSLHVAAGGGWLGAALCMLVISWTNQDAVRLYPLDLVLEELDLVAMIPIPLVAAVTGLLLSWGTVWGFFRWYWVIGKQCVTYAVMVAAPFTVHEWIGQMTALSRTGGTSAGYAAAHELHVLGSIARVVAIACVIGLSVLKPWGRRRAAPLVAARS